MKMLACFTEEVAADLPSVRLLRKGDYAAWLDGQDAAVRRWLAATGFAPKPRRLGLLPAGDATLAGAVFVVDDAVSAADASALAAALPATATPFRIDDPDGLIDPFELHYGWVLAGYRFARYQQAEGDATARLATGNAGLALRASRIASSIFLARDLVNTPANDMGPAELEAAIRGVAAEGGADIAVIEGLALLEQNYPMIHAVGRGSARAPRLIDLRWGDPAAPRLTLVGKGVCFDTGGLDIKPSTAMRNMKKDMGGAAVMTGLARAVMAAGLPVRLRLLVPAVENSISGAAFRPGDVLPTRKGLTVEIGNTDAEGRLVLADALTEADSEAPDLLIDAATLTGAARVAVGTDLPALFATDDAMAQQILDAGIAAHEPLWRLPLHPGYRAMLESSVADLSSTGSKPFAGAITAALFLARFVETTRAYAHLDIFAWNDESRPGRPRGGEATGLRALFTAIERRFGGA